MPITKKIPSTECFNVPKEICRQKKTTVSKQVPHFTPTKICKIPRPPPPPTGYGFRSIHGHGHGHGHHSEEEEEKAPVVPIEEEYPTKSEEEFITSGVKFDTSGFGESVDGQSHGTLYETQVGEPPQLLDSPGPPKNENFDFGPDFFDVARSFDHSKGILVSNNATTTTTTTPGPLTRTLKKPSSVTPRMARGNKKKSKQRGKNGRKRRRKWSKK